MTLGPDLYFLAGGLLLLGSDIRLIKWDFPNDCLFSDLPTFLILVNNGALNMLPLLFSMSYSRLIWRNR